ncbi:MAG: dihydrolipoamide acetyltransferase family protein [Actinomycetota bacterium]|nr:dihydrolipoamide acetyltransferase family protein [Actinomycetota bacterium]
MMPVITASGEEAVVTAWFVDEGGACTEGQLIAEVQTEKISVDVEAPAAGYVMSRVELNEPVPQGAPICLIADSAELPDVTAPATSSSVDVPPARVTASPSAKRVAKELGVDLTALAGTGPGGRITEADVRAVAGAAPNAAGGLRAVIARNMRRSHSETAPVTLHSTVQLGPEKPSRITARVVKLVSEVLADHPHLNGYRDGDDFVTAEMVHMAVAIQTAEGLIAPVVRDPASLTVDDISAAIEDLAERATAGTLTADDFEGGTFTVTNLGFYGVDGFTPIINLPQVAILGVGAIRQVPVIDETEAVTTGYQMVLSLTFDHAFVDGAPAAEFLQQVEEKLA